MTEAELKAMLTSDFLTMDGLSSFTYTDTASAGNSSQTVNNARMTFQVMKSFGEAAVKGYQIDSVGVTFPVDELSVTAKLGDTFVMGGNTYEVTEAALKTASTRWQVTGERAFIESDFVVSIGLKRFTLSTDVAGSVTETETTVGTYSAIIMQEDDQADLINRLGVKGDKQSVSFFVAQTVSVLPMDFITYSGRDYRVSTIADEGRVARLKRIRTELYA